MKRTHKTYSDLITGTIVEISQRITAALLLVWLLAFVVATIVSVITQNAELYAAVMLGLLVILLPWAVGVILWTFYTLFRKVLDFVIHGRRY